MSFEQFKMHQRRAWSSTISNRGVVRIGASSCFRIGLDSKNIKYTQLFFDKQNNQIGLIFSEEKKDFSAVVRNRKGTLDFSIKALLRFYDSLPKSLIVCDVFKNEDGMIIIDLNSAKQMRGTK
jgi:hypothetical protein